MQRRNRHAKIVATLGPATSNIDSIRQLSIAGVDVFRFNFSHGSKEVHQQNYESVRALEKEIRKLGRPEKDEIDSVDVSDRLARGLATDLQKILGTKVNIQYKQGKGRLEIAFYSDDELSQFCEKIKNNWGR